MVRESMNRGAIEACTQTPSPVGVQWDPEEMILPLGDFVSSSVHGAKTVHSTEGSCRELVLSRLNRVGISRMLAFPHPPRR